MPHVDAGELHALLDGAYAHESEEAARIRAHLNECADCAARLEEERAIHGRSIELLDYAAPASRALPPFDNVAGAARPRRTLPRDLSWAALVVLALGLGWFGRDLTQRRDLVSQPSAPSVDTVLVEAAAAPPPAPPPAAPREQPAAARPAPARAAERESMRDESVQKAGLESSARRESGQAMGAAAANVAPAPAAAPVTEAGGWATTTLENAERTLGRRVLLVPGLELVRLEISLAMPGEVRVFQRIPPDGTLELLQRPGEGEDMMRQAVAERARTQTADAAGLNTATMTRGGLRITARGSLPADSLQALLGKLR